MKHLKMFFSYIHASFYNYILISILFELNNIYNYLVHCVYKFKRIKLKVNLNYVNKID